MFVCKPAAISFYIQTGLFIVAVRVRVLLSVYKPVICLLVSVLYDLSPYEIPSPINSNK